MVALIIAIRTVWNRRKDSHAHSWKSIERITEQEFERQKKHLTRMEVNKLKEKKEYKQLLKVKGKSEENWNWQIK